MRAETEKSKLTAFMAALGQRVSGAGRIYFAGGATALLYNWRQMTVDIDLKADPEPPGLFEAIAHLKDELDLNVELANLDDFIPALPGWQQRSLFIARYGKIDFYHYDPYSQALSKIQRGHARDLVDARAMVRDHLITPDRLRELFAVIAPQFVRYPAIHPASFRAAVDEFCSSLP